MTTNYYPLIVHKRMNEDIKIFTIKDKNINILMKKIKILKFLFRYIFIFI